MVLVYPTLTDQQSNPSDCTTLSTNEQSLYIRPAGMNAFCGMQQLNAVCLPLHAPGKDTKQEIFKRA